jgi:14-3-3 protein epsilon
MEYQNNNTNRNHTSIPDVENLSLNDDDDEALEIAFDDEETPIQKQSFNLVGRFLTNRPIRTSIMMSKMGDIWQPGKGMDIEEAQPGLFIFRFFHQLDVQHVLKQGPWSFDNHNLVLNVLPDDVEPQDVPLMKVPFWIQLHGPPSGFMSQTVGKKVGDYIGEFLEYDEKNDSLTWRKYMHIRVLVDVRLPLKRSKKITKQGGDCKLVHFKYERLWTFCYVCGLLGHSENRCPKLFDMVTTTATRGWSPELRADTGRKQGGESKWLRHGGDPNWVAPNPDIMNNQCAAAQILEKTSQQ